MADDREKDGVLRKHLAVGRLEDFPEGATSGFCRMNRSWPGRKAGPLVEVGIGQTVQRQGFQVISGSLNLHLEVMRHEYTYCNHSWRRFQFSGHTLRRPFFLLLITSDKTLTHPSSRVFLVGESSTD